MKKNIILLATLCAVLLLSGCGGFAPIQPEKNVKPRNKPMPAKHHVIKKQTNSRTNNDAAKISLDDFSNLSLNNTESSSGNLWDQVAQGLKIPNAENRPEVQEQIRWFVAHPSYLERTTERARPYLYIVYQEVKNRNLPTELALLPINESAYYPFSYSSTGATGIWQLMPGTANDWGLKHTFWYDGRRDIFDSTNAALDYLTYLANYFNGDWLLAIAAYDTGEGNVQKAIARNLRDGAPTDFWSLHLSAETTSYVPRLLALAVIMAHPERYPVTLPPIDAKPVVAPVHVDHQIKLTDAAKLAGISVNQLKVLNPGLSRTATDPGDDTKLFLPIDSITSFNANVGSVAPANVGITQNYGHYRVQRGDTLQSIANRFNISIDQLRQANNIFTRHVATGKILLIPSVIETYKPNTEINLDQTPLNLTNEDDISAVNNNTPNLNHTRANDQTKPASVNNKKHNTTKTKSPNNNKTTLHHKTKPSIKKSNHPKQAQHNNHRI